MPVPHTVWKVVSTTTLGSESDRPDDILQQLPLVAYKVDSESVSSTLRRVLFSVCVEESYYRRVIGSGGWRVFGECRESDHDLQKRELVESFNSVDEDTPGISEDINIELVYHRWARSNKH